MYNTIQLAHRLARNLAVPDPDLLPADAALDVLSAMNAGMVALYRELPGIYKRTTLSHTLRAPRTLSVTFAAQYGHAVAANTFTVAEMGCTLRFDNSAADTEITGTASVLDDYLRTDLTTGAKIYYDAAPIEDVIERIVGHVRLYDGTRAVPTVMRHDERLRGGRARWGVDSCRTAFDFESAETGRPRYYFLDPVGASQGGSPEFLLRVWPRPETDYTLRFEAELGPQRFTFAALTTAVPVNVAGNLVDDALVPLCEAELLSSPFWRNPSAANGVITRQTAVLQGKLTKVAADIAPSRHLVGTPYGY